MTTSQIGTAADENAKDGAGQDIAGKMHEQIQAGKGHQKGYAIGHLAEAVIPAVNSSGTAKEEKGMSRREGIAVQRRQRHEERRIGQE